MTHRTGPGGRASNPLAYQWRSSERTAIPSWEATQALNGWRCRPHNPFIRARSVHLKDHSEQANRLLHWEHRSSLLSLSSTLWTPEPYAPRHLSEVLSAYHVTQDMSMVGLKSVSPPRCACDTVEALTTSRSAGPGAAPKPWPESLNQGLLVL